MCAPETSVSTPATVLASPGAVVECALVSAVPLVKSECLEGSRAGNLEGILGGKDRCVGPENAPVWRADGASMVERAFMGPMSTSS